MDGFKPEKQEPQIFSEPDDEVIRPDASDRPDRPERRTTRPRPQQSRPRFAVSRQQMMIGVAVVVLVLLIIAISSALKSPSEPETPQQSQSGERQVNLGSYNNSDSNTNDGGATTLQPSQPVTTQAGQNGVNLPAINNLPTQAQPSQTTGTGQRVDIPGDINDALNQGSTQSGINNVAQQNMNNLPPVTNTQPSVPAEPKKPVQVKPQPVKTTTAQPVKPREASKPVTAAPAKSSSAIAKAPAGSYTLQLSGASRADTLKAFAQKHSLSNYQVYETSRNGKSWFVLVYGNFPTVGDAKREVERLPAEIQGKKPWVRKMQDVHQDMKK